MPQVGVRYGIYRVGLLRVILHIDSQPASYLICKKMVICTSITAGQLHGYVKKLWIALGQGDGCDFNPCCKWETAPLYSSCVRVQRWFASHQEATPSQTNYGSQERLKKYGSAGRCGRSQKWGCRRRFAPRFKPRRSSHTRVTVWFWGSNHMIQEENKMQQTCRALSQQFGRMQERH